MKKFKQVLRIWGEEISILHSNNQIKKLEMRMSDPLSDTHTFFMNLGKNLGLFFSEHITIK